MSNLQKKLQLTENIIIAITFMILAAAAFAQVINRNLIGASIAWFDELARYCMICMTLFAAEAGLRDGSQISVTALLDKCTPQMRKKIRLVIKLVIVAFSIAVVVGSKHILATQLRSGQVSPGMGLPMVVPYSLIPIVFSIIALVQIILFFIILKTPANQDENNN